MSARILDNCDFVCKVENRCFQECPLYCVDENWLFWDKALEVILEQKRYGNKNRRLDEYGVDNLDG